MTQKFLAYPLIITEKNQFYPNLTPPPRPTCQFSPILPPSRPPIFLPSSAILKCLKILKFCHTLLPFCLADRQESRLYTNGSEIKRAWPPKPEKKGKTLLLFTFSISNRAVPEPPFRRGRDPFRIAGAWKAAPALYRGRGLKFLFYTPENENFSASKSLKNTKIASKFEPKVKEAQNWVKNWWFFVKYANFLKNQQMFCHFQNFTGPGKGPGIWGQNPGAGATAPGPGYGTALISNCFSQSAQVSFCCCFSAGTCRGLKFNVTYVLFWLQGGKQKIAGFGARFACRI